ncbi:MAG TPA: PRTRC system protein C [Thermomicrobiales bacterium]|nr:PRTRC system protein C [Thermomicrobiales bacterium]
MARVFIVDGRQFPDPDPQLSVQEVRAQFAEFFPELVNAETREEARGEDTYITFTRRIGTKGAASAAPARPRARRRGRRGGPDVVAILRRVPEKRLRVFDLAPTLRGPDGDLDLDAAGRSAPEIALALVEAEAYARATAAATRVLRDLPAR